MGWLRGRGWFPLDQRGLRDGLRNVYKIMRDTDGVDSPKIFPLHGIKEIGYSFNMRGRSFKLD